MSDSDYLDEEGNVYTGGPQKQPPSPTPVPNPPFHEDVSGALASLTGVGRGFGDPRLNTIVPNLFYQLEAKCRSLEETVDRLRAEKDNAVADAAQLRIDVATRNGQITTLEADKRALSSDAAGLARTTKYALGLCALLGPIAFGLIPDSPLVGLSLLVVAGLSAVVGFKPDLLSALEKRANP